MKNDKQWYPKAWDHNEGGGGHFEKCFINGLKPLSYII